MWQVIVSVTIFVIVRYFLKLYLQKSAFEEITAEYAEEDAKVAEAQELLKGASPSEETKDQEEDYDEHSTGHNVTKVLTATTSRRLNLSPQQIETRERVNKELMERLAKRKPHDE